MRQFSLRHSQNSFAKRTPRLLRPTSEALLTYDTKNIREIRFSHPTDIFITYIYLSGMCRANQLPEESSPFII